MNKLQKIILEIKRHDRYTSALRVALKSCNDIDKINTLYEWLNKCELDRQDLLKEKLVIEKQIYLN